MKKGKAKSEVNLPSPAISAVPTPAAAEDSAFDTAWLAGCIVVSGIAVFFRFWQLTLKPLHHDEGVNSYFLLTLIREGKYTYDPSNYHGPTLYYIALAFSKVFGIETFSIRASVGVFGVFIVVLAFFLRKYIGTVGSLAAALFLALSPGMVFISRYFIHEIFFVFCSFAVVVGVLLFIQGEKPGLLATVAMALLLLVCFLPPALNLVNVIGEQNAGLVWTLRIVFLAFEAFLVFLLMRMLLSWNEGRPVYLLLAAAATAMFFATKETAFITLGTLVMACISVWVWKKIQRGMFGAKYEEGWSEPVELTWTTFRARLGSGPDLLLLSIAVAVTFIYVFVIFFSSFFTYAEGVSKAFEAYAFWTKTGSKDHTQNGGLAYLKWGMKLESPILILSAMGTLIALVKGRHRFAMFTGFWAFGLFTAYTLIPYKTPWLALSFLLPMCVVAGYGIKEMFANRDRVIRAFAAFLAAISIGVLAFQSFDLNFRKYDDDSMPYVYAHTTRGFLDLMNQVDYYAEKSGKGKEATIEIVSPDYWPMPWYTRDYPHANYHGQIIAANTAEIVIAKKDEQDEQIREEYAAHYKNAGVFPLRPGVELVLLVRKDLADPGAKDVSEFGLDTVNLDDLQTLPLDVPMPEKKAK
jgi:uncharacterized protein (TIGR03663 family)